VVGEAVSDPSARAAILGAVRAALGDVPADDPATAARYASPTGAVAGSLVDLFCARVEDYRATVVRCAADDAAIAAAVGEALERHGARRVVVPAGVPAAWHPGAGAIVDVPPLTAAALDEVDAVLTGSALGIALTGTIVLDGAPASGRRAVSLVPDTHVCVVHVSTLVATVPEAMSALAGAVAAGRPITFISGPSATSDIELSRVEGVHGPRVLEVVVAG
jgi:L-lactate dehydrogenase complex protein LldG